MSVSLSTSYENGAKVCRTQAGTTVAWITYEPMTHGHTDFKLPWVVTTPYGDHARRATLEGAEYQALAMACDFIALGLVS